MSLESNILKSFQFIIDNLLLDDNNNNNKTKNNFCYYQNIYFPIYFWDFHINFCPLLHNDIESFVLYNSYYIFTHKNVLI